MKQIEKILYCGLTAGNYSDFYEHSSLVMMTGIKKDDVLKVKVSLHDNQERINDNHSNEDIQYWGVYYIEEDSLEMIYPKLFLTKMCSPDAFESGEKLGELKLVRVNVEKI